MPLSRRQQQLLTRRVKRSKGLSTEIVIKPIKARESDAIYYAKEMLTAAASAGNAVIESDEFKEAMKAYEASRLSGSPTSASALMATIDRLRRRTSSSVVINQATRRIVKSARDRIYKHHARRFNSVVDLATGSEAVSIQLSARSAKVALQKAKEWELENDWRARRNIDGAIDRLYEVVTQGALTEQTAAQIINSSESYLRELKKSGDGEKGTPARATKYDANRLARDQNQKFNKGLTKARSQDLGIEYYRWNTNLDGRERPGHAEQNGLYYRWDGTQVDENGKPNGGAASEHGNPGDEIQCRCYAEPVLSSLWA